MPRPDRRIVNPSTVSEKPFAFKIVDDPITGEKIRKRVVSPQITDEILSTGNIPTLEKFYKDNLATLTAEDKAYLEAKLHTSYKILDYKKKNLLNIGTNKPPYETKIKSLANGEAEVPYAYYLPDIKNSKKQTSSNGCWSYAMSLVLKSKGIDLSQEEIRAYRPNLSPTSGPQKMPMYKMLMSEEDTINNVYENADLIMELLPNHTVEQYTFPPFGHDIYYTNNELKKFEEEKKKEEEANKALTDANNFDLKFEKSDAYNAKRMQLQNQVKQQYAQAVKNQFEDILYRSIFVNHTPVILNTNGLHYMTITGYNSRTGILRVVDSQEAAGNTTKDIPLNTLLKDYILDKKPNQLGMTLTTVTKHWVPEKNNRFRMDYNDFYSMSGEPKTGISDKFLNKDEEARKGHLIGNATQETKEFRYDNKSNAKDPLMLEDKRDMPTICTVERYYPKKVIWRSHEDYNTKEKIDSDFDYARENEYQKLESLEKEPEKNNIANEGDDAPVAIAGQAVPAVNENPPAKDSFGEFIKNCQKMLYHGEPSRFSPLAALYATYKYIDDNNINPEELNTRVMTNAEKTAIADMTDKYSPLLSTYIGEKTLTDTKDLYCVAATGTAQEFKLRVNRYCNTVIPVSSPETSDAEKQKVHNEINGALQAMVDTGTGRNYFGMTRSSNSTKYDTMIAKLGRYQQSEQKDPFETYNLRKTCLDYISDKYSVRATPSGRLRFTQTMRILKNIMHRSEFNRLLENINRTRGVSSTNENYLQASDFDNQTGTKALDNFIYKVKDGEAEMKKALAKLLVVHEFTGGNLGNLVIDQNDPERSKEAFNARIKEIQKDNPAFNRLANNLFASQFSQDGAPNYNNPMVFQSYLSQQGLNNLAAQYNSLRPNAAHVNNQKKM